MDMIVQYPYCTAYSGEDLFFIKAQMKMKPTAEQP